MFRSERSQTAVSLTRAIFPFTHWLPSARLFVWMFAHLLMIREFLCQFELFFFFPWISGRWSHVFIPPPHKNIHTVWMPARDTGRVYNIYIWQIQFQVHTQPIPYYMPSYSIPSQVAWRWWWWCPRANLEVSQSFVQNFSMGLLSKTDSSWMSGLPLRCTSYCFVLLWLVINWKMQLFSLVWGVLSK